MKTNFIKPVLAYMAKLIDHIKGKRSTKLLYRSNVYKESYKAILNDNSVIDLYCIESVYVTKYDHWWVSDKKHTIYRVYGVCTPGVPDKLAEILTKGLHIGPMLGKFSSRAENKKAAIHALISILLHELESDIK